MNRKLRLGWAFSGLLAASGALADGTVTYGPATQNIPALSQVMVVVLGLLLAALAYRSLRRFPGGRFLAALAALTIAGVTAFSGAKLIEEAYANGFFNMSTFPDGVVNVNTSVLEQIINDTGSAQIIRTVTPTSPYYDCGTNPHLHCEPGLSVPNGSSCYVNFCGG